MILAVPIAPCVDNEAILAVSTRSAILVVRPASLVAYQTVRMTGSAQSIDASHPTVEVLALTAVRPVIFRKIRLKAFPSVTCGIVRAPLALAISA